MLPSILKGLLFFVSVQENHRLKGISTTLPAVVPESASGAPWQNCVKRRSAMRRTGTGTGALVAVWISTWALCSATASAYAAANATSHEYLQTAYIPPDGEDRDDVVDEIAYNVAEPRTRFLLRWRSPRSHSSHDARCEEAGLFHDENTFPLAHRDTELRKPGPELWQRLCLLRQCYLL